MRKYLVVGAGFSGAVIARELAEKLDARIDVIDARSHIGGNCHTERDALTGVLVHAYGPHIFNTDLDQVWDYVNRFATFRPFINRVKASTSRGIFSLPINLHTINQFFHKNFNPAEARAFVENLGDRSIESPQNFEEQALKLMGRELYEAFFRGYTQKQWGCDPRSLPAAILKRLPIRFNYDDNYYSTRLQGIPLEGYTSLIENILSHKNISVSTNTAYQKGLEAGYSHLFYSGPIDGYFGHVLGRLRYRTVTFQKIYHDGDFQGNAVINYPGVEAPYTRIHEHKHFTPWESHEKTVAFREFSKATEPSDTPYYPIRSEGDIALLKRYQELAEGCANTTFIGRLGTYQYLDMDDVIDEALRVSNAFIKSNSR